MNHFYYKICTIWDILILKMHLLFIWNLNLTKCPVFYLATQLNTTPLGKEGYI